MVHELSDTSFDAFLMADKPMVIDFYATWCGPCKMISPILEELAVEYGDLMTFGKIDVDANPEITSKYGVMSMPTLLVLNKGEVVNQWVGLRPKQNLVQLLGLGDM